MHIVLVGPEFEENLSLRYLAAVLRESGHSVSLARFDSPEYIDGVVHQVCLEQPGLVGLSMVFQVRAREFYDLTRALRKGGYRGHITAGGHFATFACEPMLKELTELDSVVRQEGEETIVALADALERGSSFEAIAAIAGMAVRDKNGLVRIAPPRKQVNDLDSLPFPSRDSPPELHLGVPTAFLISSRGCYADCEYCCIFAWHEAAVGKRYRMRSISNTVKEMAKLYHERGIRFFVFHDDNFFMPTAAGNRKRFDSLRQEIRTHGLKDIGLMLKLRPNDCDRENIQILKDIGLLRVFVGIENASQKQLRSLGRDTTEEEIETCLDMLREFDIFATYNIILFDPYTTLDDVAENLRFLRAHLFYPFNWCKVEPYAGTALESRFMREGRLRGDYLGYDYEIDDQRVGLMYRLLLPAFYHRNYDYYGLANLNIGLGYHLALLKHFHPSRCSPNVIADVNRLIETINSDALDLIDRTFKFVSNVELNDITTIESFGDQLEADCFQSQHMLSAELDTVIRNIQSAAGVRCEAPVGISEAFTPLSKSAEEAMSAARDRRQRLSLPGWLPFRFSFSFPVSRRGVIAMVSAGLTQLISACGHKRGQSTVQTRKNTLPQGTIRVANGYPASVSALESLTLEAIIQPDDAEVLGDPRVTCSRGEIRSIRASNHKRRLIIEYAPGLDTTAPDPNATITVAWTIRANDGDMVVATRAFVHESGDGGNTFGFQPPQPPQPVAPNQIPTIAEMAAPPIRRGPQSKRS